MINYTIRRLNYTGSCKDPASEFTFADICFNIIIIRVFNLLRNSVNKKRRGGIMSIKGEWIRYQDQSGYLARPENLQDGAPGVIVIAEIGGVNDNIEDISRRIAAAGYCALAPDFFAVNGERPAHLSKERIM